MGSDKVPPFAEIAEDIVAAGNVSQIEHTEAAARDNLPQKI